MRLMRGPLITLKGGVHVSWVGGERFQLCYESWFNTILMDNGFHMQIAI